MNESRHGQEFSCSSIFVCMDVRYACFVSVWFLFSLSFADCVHTRVCGMVCTHMCVGTCAGRSQRLMSGLFSINCFHLHVLRWGIIPRSWEISSVKITELPYQRT